MVDQSCNPERVREAAWHFPSRQRNAVERIVVVVVVAAVAVAVIAPVDTRSITKQSARSESFETAALAAVLLLLLHGGQLEIAI